MTIRTAAPQDFQTVREITQETIKAVYPHYYPAGAVQLFVDYHNDEAIRQDIAEMRVFLLYADEIPVGTVTVCKQEIGRLFVLPEHQGKGYGSALLNYAEKIVAREYKKAELCVSFPGKPLYLRRGYQAVDYKIEQTKNGDFLCYDIMEKTL